MSLDYKVIQGSAKEVAEGLIEAKRNGEVVSGAISDFKGGTDIKDVLPDVDDFDMDDPDVERVIAIYWTDG